MIEPGGEFDEEWGRGDGGCRRNRGYGTSAYLHWALENLKADKFMQNLSAFLLFFNNKKENSI